ncbi:MAG: hypothetical protein WCR30_03685 [Clostridia bacterium]
MCCNNCFSGCEVEKPCSCRRRSSCGFGCLCNLFTFCFRCGSRCGCRCGCRCERRCGCPTSNFPESLRCRRPCSRCCGNNFRNNDFFEENNDFSF